MKKQGVKARQKNVKGPDIARLLCNGPHKYLQHKRLRVLGVCGGPVCNGVLSLNKIFIFNIILLHQLIDLSPHKRLPLY